MVKKLVHTYPQIASFQLFIPLADFKAASLEWAAQFDPVSYLDSNEHAADRYSKYQALVAAGAESVFTLEESQDAFEKLKVWYEEDPNWVFGFLSYDLKNDTERLESQNPDGLGFPLIHFFRPTYILEIHEKEVVIHSQADSPQQIYDQIIQLRGQEVNTRIAAKTEVPKIRAKISKAAYLQTIETIREHIQAGDLYEMNFCQEFFADGVKVNPLALFNKLNQLSKAPFSVWYKSGDHYLLSASPERFLQKTGRQLISQPIKGTIGRGKDEAEDFSHQNQLYYSEKDRAENIMIVDLVRNDLARSCEPGTIKVEELFGIYSFQQVFQMISTISGTLRKEVHFIDAIKRAFPMGSMTGAPKVMSMELIELYEKSSRGLYSGAVGYITPSGDFDFNVVIRSLQYNARKEYLSYQVGGAIVYDSDPVAEYEECLLKAKGIMHALGIQDKDSGSKSSSLKSSQKAG